MTAVRVHAQRHPLRIVRLRLRATALQAIDLLADARGVNREQCAEYLLMTGLATVRRQLRFPNATPEE